MEVLYVWQLSIPLPAVLMITVSLYVVIVATVLGLRHCLKDKCSVGCGDCCPNLSPCEQCFKFAQVCDFGPPSLQPCLCANCPTFSFPTWDAACTCPSPDCDSCDCFCFEIRIR
ncbi:uncharacterized protein si:ch211-198p11.6 [Thalassophryne amazonica]|uniref:uncharacterized protein si:ch211-198p11.6 n=1 Tax=Thalassophryne amazonica TaxID=390379 RepID=UPI001471F03E|nr:uncharacterized protein si:ch211-198p11.6 [Thalassophryne amazonica]XP_034047124.1 uncharacterized protein si:ch211-198p11.6 [Thalassophryne amazonica]